MPSSSATVPGNSNTKLLHTITTIDPFLFQNYEIRMRHAPGHIRILLSIRSREHWYTGLICETTSTVTRIMIQNPLQACLGHSTIREYEFFKNTRFVIDKLHVYAHSRCSPAYNPYKFRDLDGINTQICEQMNSRLKALRAQLSRFSLHQWF